MRKKVIVWLIKVFRLPYNLRRNPKKRLGKKVQSDKNCQ